MSYIHVPLLVATNGTHSHIGHLQPVDQTSTTASSTRLDRRNNKDINPEFTHIGKGGAKVQCNSKYATMTEKQVEQFMGEPLARDNKNAGLEVFLDIVNYAISSLIRYGGDIERREAFIYFLLDELGCKTQDRVRRTNDNNDDVNTEEEEDAEEREFIYTVLGAAILYASYRITVYLIAAGANVHARQSWTDTYRWTPNKRIIEGRG
ncbi:uncharacterized protein N7482_001113 [Penicillium canariense]|uniref:Uncharacterized protein n=1 Tax=Penicillium canariense TaxID=189055 RepID=A0A9W9LSS5_9EURO|nr:uncharacterized protein N7482_001113 [Penicillium canariense]KAJ5175236.1 hypothetical protein N7482_001113 [Penicillium canariense]